MTSGSEHTHEEGIDCWPGCPANPEYPAPRVTNRGTEAWADHPGDSTAEVDYPEPAPELPLPDFYKISPEVSVDLTISMPDGVRMSFSEALELPDGIYSFEDVEAVLDGVLKSVRGRLS